MYLPKHQAHYDYLISLMDLVKNTVFLEVEFAVLQHAQFAGLLTDGMPQGCMRKPLHDQVGMLTRPKTK